MNSFVAAYVVCWIAITLYVACLGAAHRRLRQRLDQVEQHLEQQPPRQHSSVRAA